MAASAAGQSAAPRRFAVPWLWLGLAIALLVVYLAVRILAAKHDAPSGDAAMPGDTANAVATPATEPATPVAPLPPTATGVRVVAAPPDAEATVAGAKAPQSGAAKTRVRKAPAKVEVPTPVEAPPAPKPEPAPEPSKPAPQAAVARDPWQPMNDGLSRCAREDWIGRATCEQRLRLQYCPNYWGLVPQCPIGPSDHGS